MAAAQRALRAASVLAAAGGRARRRARLCQLARRTPAPVRAAGRQESAGVRLRDAHRRARHDLGHLVHLPLHRLLLPVGQ